MLVGKFGGECKFLMSNVLVIGGTGMLSQACVELSGDADYLAVVARSEMRLSRLGDQVSESCNYFGVSSDWNNEKELEEKLAKLNIEFDLVVAWIHDEVKGAHRAAAKFCNPRGDYFDITSHSGVNLDHVTHVRKRELLELLPKLNYHRVVLGSKNGRWLTNKEISKGVLEAVRLREDIYIAGEV